MRTKTLLLAAAAIAAGVISSQAQSNVYSANVVGYVNKSFLNQYFVMACNPLNTTNNQLSSIMPSPPEGTTVWLWNVGLQDFDGVINPIPTFAAGNWIPDPVIAPGEGFFVVGGAGSGSFTNTYVGEVPQGAPSIALVGNYNFEAIGSLVPVGGSLTNVLDQYPAVAGDTVWTWDVANQDFDGVINPIPTWTGAAWLPDANIPVGDGFFLVRASGAVTYTRNFTVQ